MDILAELSDRSEAVATPSLHLYYALHALVQAAALRHEAENVAFDLSAAAGPPEDPAAEPVVARAQRLSTVWGRLSRMLPSSLVTGRNQYAMGSGIHPGAHSG